MHKSALVRETAERLYAQLSAAGIDVLLDDRDERPGVKFADAEIMGMPIIVVVGRGLADGVVELRDRRTGGRQELPVAEIVAQVLLAAGR